MYDEYDGLAKYNNTRKLYNTISKYLDKNNIGADTRRPIVVVYINYCVYRFRKKPREKVIYLCMKYLQNIGYKW